MSRLQKLRQLLEQKELDALVISQQENRRYLSGFTGSTGWLLISDNSACLAVDFRYVEQAKKEAPDFDVIHIKGDTAGWLPRLLSDSGFKRVGFEADQITFAAYQQLCRTISDDGYQFQLIPTTGLVESVRAVKEPEELRFINEAVKLADAAFNHAKSVLRPGVSEKDAAWELEKFLREKGSEPVPFDIIVASGPNSALPHARPSEQSIPENVPVVVDLGARVNGYCSDLSRTFFLGNGDKTFSKIYDIVLGAQLTALATIKAGMNGDQADLLARAVIKQANYGEAFGHGLGHGVGLEAHESPRLGPNSPDLLVDGMVFTVEPGIYIAGWGGIRIEDTVVMEGGKTKALTGMEKVAYIC
ncbi:MAG: aminopeptidase P family protein [Chloroflexota bacterium]|nr:MAG: aminopeptidase P family protein [Chloroflexota bacterium]